MTPLAHEHAPGVYELPSLLGGAIRIAQWLVAGSEGALLVDTGIAETAEGVIEPALTELGLEPSAITHLLLTHCDVDHCGGTAAVKTRSPQAQVLAHRAEARLIESWTRLRDERYRWVNPHGLEVAAETEQWLEQAFGEPISVTRTVADGDRIALGDTTAHIVELPGHSTGLVGVWLPEPRLLIAMDAAFGRGADPAEPARVTPPQYGSVSLYRATLDRIEALSPALLGASHFAAMRDVEIAAFLKESRAFVDDLDNVIIDSLDSKPLTLGELTAMATSALGPFRADFNELPRSVHAHLEALQSAGNAIRVTDGNATGWRTP